MIVNTRDELQEKFANMFIADGYRSILLLTPRFGKIYTSINILETLPPDITILVSYPDVVTKKSWKDDFKKRQYDDSNVTYTTHRSLSKFVNNTYGIIIIDEIHLLSPAQKIAARTLIDKNDKVIDSRSSKDGKSIRRRRECLKCERRYTTHEHIEGTSLLVIKKDGRREQFDRKKILSGIIRACEKRSISLEKILTLKL